MFSGVCRASPKYTPEDAKEAVAGEEAVGDVMALFKEVSDNGSPLKTAVANSPALAVYLWFTGTTCAQAMCNLVLTEISSRGCPGACSLQQLPQHVARAGT